MLARVVTCDCVRNPLSRRHCDGRPAAPLHYSEEPAARWSPRLPHSLRKAYGAESWEQMITGYDFHI